MRVAEAKDGCRAFPQCHYLSDLGQSRDHTQTTWIPYIDAWWVIWIHCIHVYIRIGSLPLSPACKDKIEWGQGFVKACLAGNPSSLSCLCCSWGKLAIRVHVGSSERLGMEGCVCVRQHATPLQGALFRSHESVVIEFVYLGWFHLLMWMGIDLHFHHWGMEWNGKFRVWWIDHAVLN